MACRCSACTPKDTRILRFLPPSRPPNFYGSLGQITVSIHFFTFSKLSMLHHKKSSKMHTSLGIFAILRFIENNQKHAFLLHFFWPRIAIHIQYSSFVFMHFFRRKKSIKKNKKSRSLYTNGLKNLLKNHSFSFQNHVFPQEKSSKKLHLHSRNRFCLNFFSHSKNRAKLMKKHNALIRLLRKNHSKSLFFRIKTLYFHAKKHQNHAKKILSGNANGQACDRTFSR